jgi:hypothetical protein
MASRAPAARPFASSSSSDTRNRRSNALAQRSTDRGARRRCPGSALERVISLPHRPAQTRRELVNHHLGHTGRTQSKRHRPSCEARATAVASGSDARNAASPRSSCPVASRRAQHECPSQRRTRRVTRRAHTFRGRSGAQCTRIARFLPPPPRGHETRRPSHQAVPPGHRSHVLHWVAGPASRPRLRLRRPPWSCDRSRALHRRRNHFIQAAPRVRACGTG